MMDSSEPVNTGSAADLLGGAPVDASGAPAVPGDGGAPDVPDGGAVPADFLAMFPAETGEGETASLQDWVKASGVKDAAALAKIARDNQRALRESGRVKVPGEGASEAEIAEYRAAIGVPEKPADYTLPEFKDAAGNPIPINTELTASIFENAHKLGVPKQAAEQLVAAEVQRQIEEYDAAIAEVEKAANDHVKGWGADKDARLAQVNAAAQMLGFTREDMQHMRSLPSGVGKFLDAMAKVGSNFTEDALVKGERKTFGMNPAEAQAELNTMKTDPAIAAKISVPGSQERIRYERLLDVVANAANQSAAA
jgi:hypothetical protein